MRVYLDTGFFIDYLCHNAIAGTALRRAPRRGRYPPQLHQEASHVLRQIAAVPHEAATSALTCYEVEEALYKEIQIATSGVANQDALRVQSSRSLLSLTMMIVEVYGVEVRAFDHSTVSAQLQNLPLQMHGIRAADAYHVSTAVAYGAELFVCGDGKLLGLDGLLVNAAGIPIRFCDTDTALTLL